MTMNRLLTFTVVLLWQLAASVAASSGATAKTEQAEPSGAALFGQHCASCHTGTVSKAPPMSLLQIMSPGSVLRAMESGVMRSQAASMQTDERQRVAEYLTGRSLSATGAVSGAPQCAPGKDGFDFTAQPDSQGWGMTLDNRRYFNEPVAGLTAADMPKLELKWAFAYPDATRARSQPATAGGALFVGSQNGTVFSLDQTTGCVHWQFQTTAEVRTGIVISPWSVKERNPLLYFGDLVGNVYAVNAVTGKLVWRDRPDDHPSLTITAAPALYQGRLYVALSSLEVTAAADPGYACCTFRGGVAVYDARSGEKLWTAYTIDQTPAVVGKNSVGTERIAPSGAPVWGTPVIDPERGVMYVGTGENYSSPANDTSDAILALSLRDGRIVWRQQMTPKDAWNMGCETSERINCPEEDGPDYDFGAATILATTSGGKDLVLAGQKSGEVYALDPDAGGTVLWRNKLGRGGIQGGVHFGMAVDGDTLYVPMSDFDGGPRWPGEPRPGMNAVDIRTGKLVWHTAAEDNCKDRENCQPGLSAAATAIEGAVVGGAMDGLLRAYDAASGDVLWQYDTVREFSTVDGGRSTGGSFGGATGPVFKSGMMFVNSGYGIYFHMPGNVLLAFGLPALDSEPQVSPP